MTRAHELAVVQDVAAAAELATARARSHLDDGAVVVVSVDPDAAAFVHRRLGELDDLLVIARAEPDTPPLRRLLDAQAIAETATDLSDGAGRPVRMIHHFSGAAASQWWDWVRVESLVSDVLPTDGQLCIYDRDTVDDAQIDDMCATHELVHQEGRVRRNPAAIDPEQIRRELLRSPAPRPDGPPAVVLRDPDLGEARATAARLAEDAQLSADDAASLVFAVSETVANARQHGSPAVGLRAWTSPGRAHVVVEDGGPGPADTAVGLSAAPDHPSGLWLSHQLLAVRHEVSEGGFVVHLTAGR